MAKIDIKQIQNEGNIPLCTPKVWTTSFTIPANYSLVVADTITINLGITATIGAGATLKIT